MSRPILPRLAAATRLTAPLLSLVAAALLAPLAPAQSLTLLPPGTWAMDITPDGSIVVGTSNSGGFIWRWKQDPAPTMIVGGSVVAVSDDGSVLAGNITNPQVNAQEAAIYTGGQFVNGVYQGGSWVGLGWLPNALSCPSKSTAYGISGDGSTVVGLSWDGCKARGFRWTPATGMQELQKLANDNNRCTAISRDGSTLGGFAQGTSNRTPAYWDPSLAGAVLNPTLQGEVFNFTNDGSLSVGTLVFHTNPTYDAFLRDKQTGITTNLGHLVPGWSGNGYDVSEDGQTVVGFDVNGLARKAWVWRASDGMIGLKERLTAFGVPGVPELAVAVSCDDSGTIVVGGASMTTPPFAQGYIAELSPVHAYGAGTPGCTGAEVLATTAPPKVGEVTFAFTCTNAPALALGLGLVTNAADLAGSDPFGIGVLLHVNLLASTETSTLDVFSDVAGLGYAAAPLPNNPLLVGKVYYAQAVWAWPLAVCNNLPFGLSSSNGLSIQIVP